MAAEVRLTITHGLSEGKVFTFRKRTTGAIGRAEDCLVRLPYCLATLDVSRHHCLLDIDPPSLFVRDLGSKNGTFINGGKIGQREPGLPAEAAALDTVEVGLEDGDEIRVGGTTFRLSVPGTVRTRAEERVPSGGSLEHVPQDPVLVG
jgi:pSer/pThr/pTyr-binding forkhead associated (FHA) protein